MKIRLLAFITSLLALMSARAESPYISLYDGLQFEMPVIDRPTFPDRIVSVADFGGVADGFTLNTDAFNKALQTLSEQGGGVLTVPSGVWLTGPIELRSNINLHLERGAILTFSGDDSLYEMVYVVYEGFEAWRAQSPISGRDLVNVAITGQGVIDGNGGMWRPVNKSQLTSAEWANYLSKGGIVEGDTWYPSQSYIDGKPLHEKRATLTRDEAESIKRYQRPVMVQLTGCKNVLLEGVTFQNSPAWNIHPLMCENLIIDGVFVKNPAYAVNGDGLDIESCKNVIIYRTVLDCGDDAICLKSGKDEAGRRRGIPTENVIVRDCRVFRGHGGFVVGSEMSGGVNNVSVRDCEFIGTDVGLRFKSTRGRGGVVKNIFINNVNMLDISGDAITFDLYYWVFTPVTEIPPVDETTPQFRDIYISNVTSRNSGKALKFNGIPEMPIENIHVTSSLFTAREGGLLSESKDIFFRDVTIIPSSGAAMTVNNVKNALFANCKFISPSGDGIIYTGTNSNVRINP